MNLDALMALAQGKKSEIAARSNFSNIVKAPAGKSKWRILPGWREESPEKFFHDFGQHYIKDKDGNVKIVYVCEMDTFGRECGICDHLNDLIRSTKDDATLKSLKEMKSRQVHLVNAVRLDGSDANPKKPVLLEIKGSVLSVYLSNMQTYHTDDGINILSATDGRAVTIERTGSGLTTKYGLTVAARSDAVDPEALKNLIDIDKYIEGERAKGVMKGTALLESATKTIMSLSGGSIYVPPSAAKLISSPSRVIDADEDKPVVDWATKPPVTSGPIASANAAADTSLDDEELKKILAELDD